MTTSQLNGQAHRRRDQRPTNTARRGDHVEHDTQRHHWLL
jgi:hypothetical protein